jgi:hypothetical protein
MDRTCGIHVSREARKQGLVGGCEDAILSWYHALGEGKRNGEEGESAVNRSSDVSRVLKVDWIW